MSQLNYLAICCFLLLNTCSNDNDLKDLCSLNEDLNEGLIQEVITDSTAFAAFLFANEAEFVFRTELELLAAAGELGIDVIPIIDFDQFTLLGLVNGASGCDRYFHRQVTKNDEIYTYQVEAHECGGCEPFVLQGHWVLIPAITSEASVEFEFRRRE